MNRFSKLSLAALALLAFTAGPARADDVLATVPFAFSVNGQPMPAGTYHVDRDTTDPLLLVIHEVNGPHAVKLVMARPADGRDPAGSTPALQFAHHDGTYQLKAVWESAYEGQVITTVR